MTIVNSLQEISKWLNDGVCKKVKFKVPASDRQPIDDGYDYKEIHPYAFPMFLPTKDKLPPAVISNMPSICVQLLEGTDDTAKNNRDLKINLGISCWNPGIHAKDIYYPEGTKPDVPEAYRSSYDGWMDAWNFVDAILRELESVSRIKDLQIDPDIPIKFAPYKEQESGVDFYPYWFAFIQFGIRSDNTRYDNEIKDFL